ncbi:hypothetical protein N9E35_01470 [Candidatus Marinimicrobia bacterium]|nr:hypothetical protein [Candidatus Neomarinimicrobiota bacterium]
MYERLNVKLALDLIANQTQDNTPMVAIGGDDETLEFVAHHYHTKAPTWVRIANTEQVKSYQWKSNTKDKIAGRINLKELKQTLSASKEKLVSIHLEGDTLNIKLGFMTKKMKLYSLYEGDDESWCNGSAKLANEEYYGTMVGSLDPKTLNWFKGALIGSTELTGNLWQCFKGLQLMKNNETPIEITYYEEQLQMKWTKENYEGQINDSMTAYFDVDELTKPWKSTTTQLPTGGSSELIYNLGRLGKGILSKGTMKMNIWENALEFNLVIQRTKQSARIHFRTFVPTNRSWKTKKRPSNT